MISDTCHLLEPPAAERIRGLLIQKRLLEQQEQPDLATTHGRAVFRALASIRLELEAAGESEE